MNIIVNKAISKRIITAKDLSDFYAYCERENWEKANPLAIHYCFAESEQDRINDLVDEICYTAGNYDEKNVIRILGGQLL